LKNMTFCVICTSVSAAAESVFPPGFRSHRGSGKGQLLNIRPALFLACPFTVTPPRWMDGQVDGRMRDQ
jgi:hypothetical protein